MDSVKGFTNSMELSIIYEAEYELADLEHATLVE